MTVMNYVNRKSAGVKLGRIVARDLRKRLEPTSNSRPLPPETDLFVQGTKLTDDGLKVLVEGLCHVTSPIDGIVPTRLQKWNLSGNELTAKCLPFLTQAMNATSNDIQELNLSSNTIDIIKEEDLANWEAFLIAAGRCKALCELVLTGNAIGSGPAMEVFARVAVYRKIGVVNLPSIRHLSIDNTSLTDEGALFLSYVLIRHDWIHNGLPASTKCSALTKEVKRSIVCFPNDELDFVGTRLLKLAKGVKEHELAGSNTENPTALENMLSRYDSTAIGHSGKTRASNSLRSSAQSSNEAHSSGRTAGYSQVYGSDVEELESLRKKLQRGIINDHGANFVELWRAALKLLSYARSVFVGVTPTETEPNGRGWSSDLQVVTNTNILSNTQKMFNNTAVGPLPAGWWKLKLVELADPGQLLSENQRESIFEWARSRATLKRESGSAATPDSVQAWRVLHAMDCLFYDLRD